MFLFTTVIVYGSIDEEEYDWVRDLADESGTDPGSLSSPGPLAVDSVGTVYVLDLGNDRVQKFNENGGFIFQWGAPGKLKGEFNFKTGKGTFDGDIAVTSTSPPSILVADTMNDRIQKFTNTGQGGPITVKGVTFNKPSGIAVDKEGSLYISDSGNHRIVKLTVGANSEEYILDNIFGARGTGKGLFNTPTKIDVDEKGVIYVLDKGSETIKIFGSDMSGQTERLRFNIDPLDFDVKSGKLLVGSLGLCYIYTEDGDFIEEVANDLIIYGEINTVNVAFDTKSDDVYLSIRAEPIVSKYSKEG